jgi:hypothetical protein
MRPRLTSRTLARTAAHGANDNLKCRAILNRQGLGHVPGSKIFLCRWNERLSILAKRQLERAKGGATRIGDARRSGVHRTTTSEPERPGICGRWSGVTSFVEPAPRACAIQFRRRPRGAPQAQIEEGNLGNRQNRQAGRGGGGDRPPAAERRGRIPHFGSKKSLELEKGPQRTAR